MANGTVTCETMESFHFPGPGPDPGPLHTIQMDQDGFIYYSDELNHSVGSLDRNRRLRWSVGGKGSARSQFHYPRGISLGWIHKEGRPIRCLAVADAWNRRIQFLRPQDGSLADEWQSTPETGFQEPVDVRFISYNRPEANDRVFGYWAILDKQNHNLITFDMHGAVTLKTGTAFDTELAARWITSSAHPNWENLDSRFPSAEPYCDFLFYPNRVLGQEKEALFIWEPFRMILKLMSYPHIIPLPIGTFPDRQWIAADSAGLIEWSRAGQRFNYYDSMGNLLDSVPVHGTPIPSNLPSNELWIQTENSFQHLKFISCNNSVGTNTGSIRFLMEAHKKRHIFTGEIIPSILRRAIEQYRPGSILVYGAGNEMLMESLKVQYPGIRVTGCIFASDSQEPAIADIIITTNLLEHTEPDQIHSTLREMGARARLAQYHQIACHKAREILPDGRNAHLIVEPPEYWDSIIRDTGFEILETATEQRLSKTPFENGEFINVVKHEVVIQPG